MNEQKDVILEPKRKTGLAVPILFGIVLALVGANAVTFIWLDGVKQDLAALRQSMSAEIAKVQESATLGNSTSRQHLEKLRAELDQARQQTAATTGQVRKEALKHAEELARRIQEEQARQQAQVATQLSEVKEAANATQAKISDVSTDVGNVRSEVASTKSELEKTISELKSVRGDLGVQSGLIATNARELAALRALGDRTYYEFRIKKSKEFQKVGAVQVLLSKADFKKNKYTVQLIADDKKVEKKDKTTNEPVQFYLTGARQPVELVVNEIAKDQISGYLAVPKTLQARN
jgi:chromosome segregation ATPase